jgi:hypothetical protein
MDNSDSCLVYAYYSPLAVMVVLEFYLDLSPLRPQHSSSTKESRARAFLPEHSSTLYLGTPPEVSLEL